jgi:hypothetical protein
LTAYLPLYFQTKSKYVVVTYGNNYDWAVLQQRYYDSIRSQKTGKRWVVASLKKLWAVAWDLWELRNGLLHDHKTSPNQAEELRLTNNSNSLSPLLLLKISSTRNSGSYKFEQQLQQTE